MALIVKTLSCTISGLNPNGTYNWTNSGLVGAGAGFVSTSFGTITTNGVVTVDFQYNDTTAENAIITLTVTDTVCTKTRVLPFVYTPSIGVVNLFSADVNSFITIVELSVNCAAIANSTCVIPNIPYGTYTVEISTNCSPQTSSVTCNGVTQTGNGLFSFIVVTNAGTPNIIANTLCF